MKKFRYNLRGKDKGFFLGNKFLKNLKIKDRQTEHKRLINY